MKQLSAIILFFSLFFLFSATKSYADDPCTEITTGPDLYQVTRTGTQATLYFTPVNDQIITYTIIYGLKPEDEKYSITINQGASSGAIAYTLNDLDPNVKYYYKVKGDTSCTSSPWSTWIGDTTLVKGSSDSAVPVTGSETTMAMTAFSLLMMLGGFGVFAFATRKN